MTSPQAAEIDRLMALADDYADDYAADWRRFAITNMRSRATLRAALEAALADGERYRAWRDEYTRPTNADETLSDLSVALADAWEPAQVDAAFDAAMAKVPSDRPAPATPLTAASSIQAEVRRDAERYRWLRRFDHFARVDGMLDTTEYTTLDAAVDAAIATEVPAGCGYPYCGGNAPECKTCRSERAASPTPSDVAVQAGPPKCDNRQQCSPSARYDEVSHGPYSLTLKCRLCGGIRRSGWD